MQCGVVPPAGDTSRGHYRVQAHREVQGTVHAGIQVNIAKCRGCKGHDLVCMGEWCILLLTIIGIIQIIVRSMHPSNTPLPSNHTICHLLCILWYYHSELPNRHYILCPIACSVLHHTIVMHIMMRHCLYNSVLLMVMLSSHPSSCPSI